MKIVLTEEQNNKLKLPPFVYKAILNKHTSLGDNPAIPPYGDFGLEYHVVKSKFEDVSEIIDKHIEQGILESKDLDYLLSVLSEKIKECKQKEEPIRPQLEKLCENIVNQYFAVPIDTVLLTCKLVGEVKPENDVRFLPEEFDDFDKNTYNFEDVEELERANKAIFKRRFINCLIQGLSYWLSTDLDDWCDTVNELNEDIWGLWYDIIHISDYLLFTKKEELNEKHPNLMSYVEVKLGRLGKKTIINSQGTIFPYLLRDTIRGFLELFSSHGLPDDTQQAMYIVKKADFLVAEPWDLRLGMGIIEMLQKSLTKLYHTELLFDTKKIPYFFEELCSLKTDEFNMTIKNFLLHTKKGKIIANIMDSNITNNIDYQQFKDRITQKNIQTSLISDGDFSKEELDNYVLQENATDEMMAYHGTGANFDKFNHKKYLNTGAGSQTFGWGTYVTNDEAVAKGYSDNAKSIDGNTVEEITNFLVNKYNYDWQNAEKEAHDIVSNFKWAGSLSEFISLCKKDSASYYLNDTEAIERNKRWIDVVQSLKKTNAVLYEVDIPDDNGQNYFEWYEHFPKEFMKRVLYGFLKIPEKYLNQMANKNYPFRCDLYQRLQWIKENPNRAEDMINIVANEDDYGDFLSSSYYTRNPDTEGKNIYGRLRELMGSPKAASLFLMQCGFDGIKYPSGTKWQKPDGAAEDAYNYVIFDANKVKITNKTIV